MASGATLVAKELRRTNIEIVEVYAVKHKKGTSYVAYISQGDERKYVEKALAILNIFVDVAIKGADLIEDVTNIEIQYGESKPSKKNLGIYKNMRHTLLSIGKEFHIDIIVIACHNDAGEKGSTIDAINKYVNKNDSIELKEKVHVDVNAPNLIQEMAKANDTCASEINVLVDKSL